MIIDLQKSGNQRPALLPGAAVYHIDGFTQHAGILMNDWQPDGSVRIYGFAGRTSTVETWNRPSGRGWKLSVVGLIQRGFDTSTIHGAVLRRCDELEAILAEAFHGPGSAEGDCHWRIHPSEFRFEYNESTGTVEIYGSCAGFVDFCFRKVGMPLVDLDQLPESVFRQGESDYIKGEYDAAPGKTIRRLYPSYQIRAFQEDENYPWTPDLRFSFYPVNFY